MPTLTLSQRRGQMGDARDVSTSMACAVAGSRALRLLPTFMPEGDTRFLFQITEE